MELYEEIDTFPSVFYCPFDTAFELSLLMCILFIPSLLISASGYSSINSGSDPHGVWVSKVAKKKFLLFIASGID